MTQRCASTISLAPLTSRPNCRDLGSIFAHLAPELGGARVTRGSIYCDGGGAGNRTLDEKRSGAACLAENRHFDVEGQDPSYRWIPRRSVGFRAVGTRLGARSGLRGWPPRKRAAATLVW